MGQDSMRPGLSENR